MLTFSIYAIGIKINHRDREKWMALDLTKPLTCQRSHDSNIVRQVEIYGYADLRGTVGSLSDQQTAPCNVYNFTIQNKISVSV